MTIADVIKKEFENYATENNQRADLRYLESPLVVKYVAELTGKESMYSIRDAEIAKDIYLAVQKDVANINAHQNYSAAVLHYSKFLSLKIKIKK
ncbi:MAG: hypothetical protein IKO82_04215 [Prevotella sp.]|nr:hypothetical protein [Prevotella sp.]